MPFLVGGEGEIGRPRWNRRCLGLNEDAVRTSSLERFAEVAGTSTDVGDHPVEQRCVPRELVSGVLSQGSVEEVGIGLLNPERSEEGY